MIESEHIRDGRAEYTFNCGWIDWSHAGGNPNGGDTQTRDDIRLLWRQFARAPLRMDGGFVVSYEPVVDDYTSISLLTGRGTSEGFTTVGSPYCFFVRHRPDREGYKRIAFELYQRGCIFAENLQQASPLNWVSGSAFSFEDFVSNLVAFYRHVEGWNKARILQLCGALQRDADRVAVSQRILDAMGRAGVDQRTIRATNWSQAYVVNDLATLEVRQAPLHGGPYAPKRMWVELPYELRRIQPVPPSEQWYWVHPNADLERRYLRNSR